MAKITRESKLEDVHAFMLDMIGQIEDGSVELAKAKEVSNAYGKILKGVALKLQYAELRKQKPVVSFLDD